MLVEFDNPGGGDCAFYSFAMGLINIIQQEHRQGRQDHYLRWCQLDERVRPYYEQMLRFDFKSLDRSLLTSLQQSLRHCLIQQYQQRLICAAESYSSTTTQSVLSLVLYTHFVDRLHRVVRDRACNLLFEPDCASMMNDFSAKVALKIREYKRPVTEVMRETAELIVFTEDIFIQDAEGHFHVNPASRLFAAVQRKISAHWWGTEEDMIYLAKAFATDIEFLRMGKVLYPASNFATYVLSQQQFDAGLLVNASSAYVVLNDSGQKRAAFYERWSKQLLPLVLSPDKEQAFISYIESCPPNPVLSRVELERVLEIVGQRPPLIVMNNRYGTHWTCFLERPARGLLLPTDAFLATEDAPRTLLEEPAPLPAERVDHSIPVRVAVSQNIEQPWQKIIDSWRDKSLHDSMHALGIHILNLEDKGKAGDERVFRLREVHGLVFYHWQIYQQNKTRDNLLALKKEVEQLTEFVEPLAAQHSGWKDILCKAVLCLSIIGAIIWLTKKPQHASESTASWTSRFFAPLLPTKSLILVHDVQQQFKQLGTG
jgi:hypothetical protein